MFLVNKKSDPTLFGKAVDDLACEVMGSAWNISSFN